MQEKKFCPNCGYQMRFVASSWACDACTYQEKVEVVTMAAITSTGEYDVRLCLSNDHKDAVEQMGMIDRAMRRYFGKELHVPEHVQLNELNEEVLVNTGVLVDDWLDSRKEILPDSICYSHIPVEELNRLSKMVGL